MFVVGGGPAGLSAANRLKQLAADQGADQSVCVLEKGSEVGAHTLSGAVMDPMAMNELFPGWKERGAPLTTEVTEDRFLFQTETGSYQTPNWLLPGCFPNHGNYVISLVNVVRWLGTRAEAPGVGIFPGFAIEYFAAAMPSGLMQFLLKQLEGLGVCRDYLPRVPLKQQHSGVDFFKQALVHIVSLYTSLGASTSELSGQAVWAMAIYA